MPLIAFFDHWYDLENFVHPGGCAILDRLNNQNGTEALKLYHPFTYETYLKRIQKYQKHEVTNPIESTPDSYELELLDQVKPMIQKKNLKMKTSTKIIYSILFLLHLFCCYGVYCENIISMIIFPFSIWITFIRIIKEGHHRSLHQKENINLLFTRFGVLFSGLVSLLWIRAQVNWFYVIIHFTIPFFFQDMTTAICLILYKEIIIFILFSFFQGHNKLSSNTTDKNMYSKIKKTVTNYHVNNTLMKYVSAGYNTHTIHQYFPFVNSDHHQQIDEIINKL